MTERKRVAIAGRVGCIAVVRWEARGIDIPVGDAHDTLTMAADLKAIGMELLEAETAAKQEM